MRKMFYVCVCSPRAMSLFPLWAEVRHSIGHLTPTIALSDSRTKTSSWMTQNLPENSELWNGESQASHNYKKNGARQCLRQKAVNIDSGIRIHSKVLTGGKSTLQSETSSSTLLYPPFAHSVLRKRSDRAWIGKTASEDQVNGLRKQQMN